MRRKIQQEEERMRGVETRIQEIRHAIFTEVAKMAYDVDSPVEKTIEEIPYRVIPGEVGNFRNDVFLERAIVGERLRLAMGLPCRSAAEHAPISDNIKLADQAETYYTPPLINVIKFACNACHEKRVLITEGCQGCLAHPCSEVCPKGAISMVNGKSYIDQAFKGFPFPQFIFIIITVCIQNKLLLYSAFYGAYRPEAEMPGTVRH